MFIHWFPGHMTKALREMEADASKVDSIVYVLDARIPLSSVNPSYDIIFSDKPRLYVLNKADLVPQNELVKWQEYFSDSNSKCITANSTINGGNKAFISALRSLVAPLMERYALKGVKKTVRAMVIGIPNCATRKRNRAVVISRSVPLSFFLKLPASAYWPTTGLRLPERFHRWRRFQTHPATPPPYQGPRWAWRALP